jgi:O-antigen ligase
MSTFYKYNLEFIKILIILFPLFFITGSFLPDLACVYIGIFYLILCIKKENRRFDNYIFLYFFFLYLYLVINSFFSYNVKISLQSALPFLRIILFIFSLNFFFTKYPDLKKKIYFVFIICISILLIDSILQFITGYNLFGSTLKQPERITSFFSKQIMGSYVSRLLPFIIAISFLLNLKKIDLINIIIILISGILIFLSSERLALAYFLVTVAFYFYINFSKKLFIFFLSTLLLFIVILNFYSSRHINKIIFHTYNQVIVNNKFLGTSYRHALHYEAAYKMFLDKPLVGNGLKSFRSMCGMSKYSLLDKIIEDNSILATVNGKFYFRLDESSKEIYIIGIVDSNNILHQQKNVDIKNSLFKSNFKDGDFVNKGQILYNYYEFLNGCNTHPHNIYLEFLSELGFIGFALFFFIFLYTLYKLFYLINKKIKKKLSKNEACKFFILLGFVTSMFPLFPSGSYFNNWLLIITYLPIGFYLSLLKLKND